MQTTKPQEEIRYQCRHIFTDGHRCASPCLKSEDFCYYHHTTRRPITPETRERREANKARHTTFELPLLEDRSSIQAAIGEVLRRIASNELDPRRAGLLLYGLQIASMNFPRPTEPKSAPPPAVPIEEITTDPIHGTLAPRTEIHPPKGFFDDLLEELRQSNATQPKPTSLEPNVLPNLHATAAEPPRPASLVGRPPLVCRLPFCLAFRNAAHKSAVLSGHAIARIPAIRLFGCRSDARRRNPTQNSK